ncbi:MAG: L,D-transpeptidase [Bacteroidota bacterium]
MKKILLLLIGFTTILFFSCKRQEKQKLDVEKVEGPVRHKPKDVAYQIQNAKEWLTKNKSDSTSLRIVCAVNRTDTANLKEMDSILVPEDLSGDIEFYLPFPLEVEALKEVNKIIFFSYTTQIFAAYENGYLVHTGPTNMGREKDPTPTGLFFTNWKAEQTTSTFNDEWDLKWNFNIANKLGVGFHQYDLPGYPASHSCLRLQEKDARYLYDWADEWILADEENVKVKGTPVIVFGNYDFKAAKPWLQLVSNPKALDITATDIEKTVQAFMSSIMKAQKERTAFKG